MYISKFISRIVCFFLVGINLFYSLPVQAITKLNFTNKVVEKVNSDNSSDNNTIPIIKDEIISMRESNKKYFKMSDGSTMVALYSIL